MTLPFWLVVRLVAYIAALYGVYIAARWISSRSTVTGAIFAIGVGARIVLGLVLFAVSYYQLPLLSQLQAGDGFWTLAIDARSYFNEAAAAVTSGLSTISSTTASPMYVRALAAWMIVFGVSPVSAVLLNLICYVIAAVMVVYASPPRGRAALFGVVALTVSPALVIFGTQPLKDTFGVLLIATAFAGVRLWSAGFEPDEKQRHLYGFAGAALLVLSVYLSAGIRAYYALFMIVALVNAAVVLAARARIARWKIVSGHIVIVPILWLSFISGAGAYYPYYESLVFGTASAPLRPLLELDHARAAFVASGGDTSFAGRLDRGVGDQGLPIAPVRESGGRGVGDQGLPIAPVRESGGRLDRWLLGCAVLVVPVSILQAMSIVTFSGGRGLLFITDLDTLMIDLSVVAALYLLATLRPRPALSVVVFGFVLVLITTITMAYVVTNFGTLFRLRLIAIAPLWMLPAFTSPSGRFMSRESADSTGVMAGDPAVGPSQPIRVVHLITDLDVGGAEMMLGRLLEAWDVSEIENTVISLTSGGALASRLIDKRIRVVELGMSPGKLNVGGVLRAYRLLRKLQPHVVQTWLYHADLVGLVAATLARVPAVVWNVRCAELTARDHPPLLRLLVRGLALLSGRPAAVICNSTAGRRAHERIGYRPRRWVIIPNGFDTDVCRPSPDERASVRRELLLSDAVPLVGLLARYHPMKDHATFLKAAAIVVRQHPETRFLIAGRGVPESASVRRLVDELQLSSQVFLRGERRDAPQILTALDVAVSSSYSEAFPNVVAEAMACGTPVVVTDAGDSATIVGNTGVVVPPRDPEALAAAVTTLIEMDATARRSMGLAGRARVASEYSLRRAADHYQELYEELSALPKARRFVACAG